jgi:hypothetical protein
MPRSVKHVLITLVGVTVLAGATSLVTGGQEPAAKLAPPEKPASIEAYERLVAELEGRPMDPLAGAVYKPFPEDAKDIVEGYDRLFKRLHLADVFEVDEGVLLSEAPHKWTEGDKAKIAKFLDANQDLLSEIRQMAQRGAPVYPLDFSKGYEMLLPHLSRTRQCARMLRASAVVNGMNGDYVGAVEDIIAGMKLGDALAREPMILSQLVRIAIYGVMSSAVENSFDGSDLSPELTRRLVTHLAQADRRDDFAEMFAGEIYCRLKAFAALRAGERSGLPAESDFGPPEEADERAYVEIMTRLAAAARLPYYEVASEISQIQSDVDNLPQNLVYSRQLPPGLIRLSEAQARHEAVIDLMQIGILVEQYKAREGHYPDTLDAIASSLGSPVPVDPFSGKGYRYRPLGSTFLLYSIGRNRLDDGGTHYRHYMKGDIVWRGEQKK